MRILLFLATNLAVILVASFTLRLLGVDSYLAGQGIDYGSLLAFAAVFGFAGAIEKLGIERRLYTMGAKKSLLDPFKPERPEDVARRSQDRA